MSGRLYVPSYQFTLSNYCSLPLIKSFHCTTLWESVKFLLNMLYSLTRKFVFAVYDLFMHAVFFLRAVYVLPFSGVGVIDAVSQVESHVWYQSSFPICDFPLRPPLRRGVCLMSLRNQISSFRERSQPCEHNGLWLRKFRRQRSLYFRI